MRIAACGAIVVYVIAWWIAVRSICGRRFHPWGWIPPAVVLMAAYSEVTISAGKCAPRSQLMGATYWLMLPVGIITVGFAYRVIRAHRKAVISRDAV